MPLWTITADLLDACVNSRSCKGCSYRVGCFVRYSFYVFDTEAKFDAFLKQDIETDSNQSALEITKEVTNDLRQKYKDERLAHPEYSEV